MGHVSASGLMWFTGWSPEDSGKELARLLTLRIAQHLIWWPLLMHDSVAKEADVISNVPGETHLMRGHHQGETPGFEFAHRVKNFPHQQRIQR